MRKPDPVEIVAVGLPVLAEVVSVSLFIAFIALVAALWCGA
jgi:hypothetical protein